MRVKIEAGRWDKNNSAGAGFAHFDRRDAGQLGSTENHALRT